MNFQNKIYSGTKFQNKIYSSNRNTANSIKQLFGHLLPISQYCRMARTKQTVKKSTGARPPTREEIHTIMRRSAAEEVAIKQVPKVSGGVRKTTGGKSPRVRPATPKKPYRFKPGTGRIIVTLFFFLYSLTFLSGFVLGFRDLMSKIFNGHLIAMVSRLSLLMW